MCYIPASTNRNILMKDEKLSFLAPLTFVRQSLSDTNLSGARQCTSTFSNQSLPSHLLFDSFETRYTYFLCQSPNFHLFRILKFGFSYFL